MIDPDHPEYDDLVGMAYAEQAERRYQGQLARHPDPRDPDHPGEWREEDNESLTC